MHLDNTSSAHADSLPNASGVAIFWALASLALTSMTQPSFCGHVLGTGLSNVVLWPHRSSPAVCLVDAVADVSIVMHRPRPAERDAQRRSTASQASGSTVVVMKMVLFIVGVVPQAIKLFSIRGIPVSQSMGAVFVVSIISNTIRSLTSDASADNLAAFGESLPTHFNDLDMPALTMVSVVLPHLVLVWATWSRIESSITIDVSDNVADAFHYLAFGVNVLWVLHAIQHTLSIVVRGEWTIPRLPVLIMMGSLNVGSFPSLLMRSAQEQPPSSPIKRCVMIANVGLCCLALSCALFAGARAIGRSAAAASNSLAALPTPEQESTADDAANSLQRPQLDVEGDLGLARIPQAAPEARSEPLSPSGQPSLSTAQHPSSLPSEATQKATTLSRSALWPWKSVVEHFQRARAKLAAPSDDPDASSPAPSRRSLQQHLRDRARSGFIFLRLALKITLHALVVLVWRLLLSFSTFYGYGWEWTADHLQSPRNRDVAWLAFGIFNALTAACYYLVVFDGAGTSAPAWAGMLG